MPTAVLTLDVPKRLEKYIDIPTDVKNEVEDIKENVLPTKTSLLIKQNIIDFVSDFFYPNGKNATRKKRQADLNIPIPTALSFYIGKSIYKSIYIKPSVCVCLCVCSTLQNLFFRLI